MTRKLILLIALALAVGIVSGGFAIAAGAGAGPQATTPAAEDDDAGETDDAGRADEDDAGLTGTIADRAAEAALAIAGGGTVLAVEDDDGGAGYEVEIRKADGSEVEVELDKSFGPRQSAGDDD